MKTLLKTTGISLLVLFGALASGSAMADHDGHVRFGVTLGMPLFAPDYYSPYNGYPYPAYAYPPVVVQSAPPVYVEQSRSPGRHQLRHTGTTARPRKAITPM